MCQNATVTQLYAESIGDSDAGNSVEVKLHYWSADGDRSVNHYTVTYIVNDTGKPKNNRLEIKVYDRKYSHSNMIRIAIRLFDIARKTHSDPNIAHGPYHLPRV